MNEIDIIFEDEFILVVNKPAGIATQAPRQYDSLEARIRNYLTDSRASGEIPYLGIPHRIDRCVSGAMVFAKRKKSARRLAKQFERREVEKSYQAIVSGHLELQSGTLRDSMRKIPEEPKAEIVSADREGAKLAVLHYQVVSETDQTSRLAINLETGRMHQIRVQFGSRRHAVLGDEMYGSHVLFGKSFEHDRDRQIALHASELKFEHPQTREQVSFRAALPESWQSDESR